MLSARLADAPLLQEAEITAVAGREVICVVQVVIGVDTHQDEHVAVAIDQQGVRLAERYAPATSYGYGELERWACKQGEVRAFGVEGTGSCGAGFARFLTGRCFTVVEVNRPDRLTWYRKGKSDPTDAEMATRAVLAGVANATPKSGEGEIEMMIPMLKSAKGSAVKVRTQAVNQMKALVVTAPAALRETLDGLTATALAARCKSFRPGRLEDSTAAAILVAVGSNPERLHSEAAFASLCGVSTKIHLVADARGRPMRFSITGGQRADVSQVIPLLSGIKAGAVIADKG